jgi:hypothetical protein
MKKILVLIAVVVLCCGATYLVLQGRVDKLEKQVTRLQLGGAEGAGASFYPASGGLEGTGTGYLGKITGTADKDVGFVVLNDHAIWGNAFFPYSLDADGNAGGAKSGATPYAVVSGDGGTEVWELPDVYGMRLYGNIPLIVSGVSSTIGTDTDGALIRVANGGMIYIAATSASGVTITLPQIVDVGSGTSKFVEPGASVCIASGETDTVQFWVDPNAADTIIKGGAKGAAGASVYNSATATGGDYACFVAVKPDAWLMMGYSGTWTAE